MFGDIVKILLALATILFITGSVDHALFGTEFSLPSLDFHEKTAQERAAEEDMFETIKLFKPNHSNRDEGMNVYDKVIAGQARECDLPIAVDDRRLYIYYNNAEEEIFRILDAGNGWLYKISSGAKETTYIIEDGSGS